MTGTKALGIAIVILGLTATARGQSEEAGRFDTEGRRGLESTEATYPVAVVPSIDARTTDGPAAAAPPDQSAEQLLGAVFDNDFRQVPGRVEPAIGVQRNAIGRVGMEYREVESTVEVQANLQAWGIAAVSHSTAQSSRHAVYRAYSIEGSLTVGDRITASDVDARARWYIAEVRIGRMYELRLSGSADAVRSAVEARWGPMQGSGSTSSSEFRGQYNVRAVGFEAPDGLSVVRSESEIRRMYLHEGDARPILVVYRRIPQGFRQADRSRRLRVVLVRVQFPPTRPGVGGRPGPAWDIMGGQPEIFVQVSGPELGIQRPNASCPHNRLWCDMNLEIGEGITVASDSALWFAFSDLDMSENDPAGGVGVTMEALTDGRSSDEMPPDGLQRQISTPEGIRFDLRVWER